MMNRMRSWPQRIVNVGDVRGLGLMLAFELVKGKQTREPFPELRNRVVELAFERGLLVLGAGESTVRLSPPLILTSPTPGTCEIFCARRVSAKSCTCESGSVFELSASVRIGASAGLDLL